MPSGLPSSSLETCLSPGGFTAPALLRPETLRKFLPRRFFSGIYLVIADSVVGGIVSLLQSGEAELSQQLDRDFFSFHSYEMYVLAGLSNSLVHLVEESLTLTVLWWCRGHGEGKLDVLCHGNGCVRCRNTCSWTCSPCLAEAGQHMASFQL